MEEKCINCKFYLEGSDRSGMCRRHPPLPVVSISYNGPGEVYSSDQSYNSFFPEVYTDEWCGEWKERK